MQDRKERRLTLLLNGAIATFEDVSPSMMGALDKDEELLTAGAYKVIWSNVTSTRLDTTALKKALPDVAAAYTKTTTVRRFSVR